MRVLVAALVSSFVAGACVALLILTDQFNVAIVVVVGLCLNITFALSV